MKIIALAIVLVAAGCGWLKSTSRAVADDVVDCTRAEAVRAAGELGPAIRPLVVSAVAGERPDWSQLRGLAKSWSVELGGCVLANVVTDLEAAVRGAPKTHSQQLDPAALHAGARALLVERFGNARTFKTATGSL
jgi:hypothetical protein